MATKLLKTVANFETTLASRTAIGATSFTLTSGTDSDGVALAAGSYGFTINEGQSNEEHCECVISGTAATSVKTVTRQLATGTSGLLKEHRKGESIKITNHPALRRIGDILDGTTALNGSAPYKYDSDPTYTPGNKELVDYDAMKTYADGIASAGAADATTTQKGISKMSVAPAVAASPIAVGDNDPRVPLQAENDALVGTSGTASSTNKYVTNDDTATTTGVSKVVRALSSGKIDSSFIDPSSTTVAYTFGETIGAGIPVFVASGVNVKRVVTMNHRSNRTYSNGYAITSSVNRKGQAFNSGGFTSMTGVKLKIHAYGGNITSQSITVDVYALSGGGIPTGASLGTKVLSGITVAQNYGAVVEATFASAITLTANTNYCVCFYSSSGFMYFAYDNTAPYTGGTALTETASVWAANTADDFYFEIISDLTAPTAGRVYIAEGNSLTEANKTIGVTYETGTVGVSKKVHCYGLVQNQSFGAMTTTVSETTDVNQTSVGVNSGQIYTGVAIQGQIFRTGNIDAITKIGMYLEKISGGGGIITVSLYEMIEDATDDTVTDTAVLELGGCRLLSTATIADGVVGAVGFYDASFSSAVQVRPFTQYFFTVSSSAGDVATNYYKWYYAASNVLTDSMGLRLGVFQDEDYGFRTKYVTTRAYYAGDTAYLTDGIVSITPNDRYLSIGTIQTPSIFSFNDQTPDTYISSTLNIKYMASGYMGINNFLTRYTFAGTTFKWGIPRNTRKIFIQTYYNNGAPYRGSSITLYRGSMLIGDATGNDAGIFGKVTATIGTDGLLSVERGAQTTYKIYFYR